MNSSFLSRRGFLQRTAAASTLLGLTDLDFIGQLPRVSAAEAALDSTRVRLRPEIEPLVRLLENTPRSRVLEEVAARIKTGTSYKDTLAAILLAGVRNIQPRPVGFKFHAVLVVNSAHLASMASPDTERWLPIFWAIDEFKSSQARDVAEGDWTMAPVDEAKVPPAHKAREAFIRAMDNWDVEATDAATAGLARSLGAHEVFQLFSRYGARDFRDIGHKAIYVSNSWRTLQTIGWQHAEPILRSLAYALLAHRGGNPAQGHDSADADGRRNLELLRRFPSQWAGGKPDRDATLELLKNIRSLSSEDASTQVLQMVQAGVAVRSIWDALFTCSTELLMRRPGIVSLHAVTSTNALHYAFQHCGNDETRRLILLQTAAFLTRFRGKPDSLKELWIDQLEPVRTEHEGGQGVDEIFAEVSKDRLKAAQKIVGYLDHDGPALPLIDRARQLLFLKGNNSHDYKFSSAVLEDYHNISPEWRNRYLAASVFNLRGSGDQDNSLVKRTRAALVG